MSLADWIDRRADFTPDKAALRFHGEDISYASLAQTVARLAGVLANDLHVRSGDRVAYLGYNSPENIALLFACARLGAILVPLNWRLATPEHEQVLHDCAPVALFVEPDFQAPIHAVKESLALRHFIAIRGGQPGWLDYGQLMARAAPVLRNTSVPAGTPVLISYTSGSTGKPKGVVLSQDALAWNAVNSTHMHDMTSDDRVLTTLPLFHVGGLNIQTVPALHAGATVTLHPKFDAGVVLKTLRDERITLAVLVPAQLNMMIEHPDWAASDLSSLRMITTGSTLVPEGLIRTIHDRGVPLIQVYGSTETCPIAAYIMARDAMRKAGSTGKAAVHCDVRLVDDLGNDVPQGASGEIVVRGPSVMNGYWNSPQATAAALRDGWYHTGDMARRDEEGFLYVDGRKKDMIISGGENVYPAELENVLAECDAIEEASVVGRPDERWGEMVVAVVVPKPGVELTSDDVMGLFQGRIARYKHPRQVIFTDQLPRTAVGKIKKEEVRKLANQRLMEHN